MGKIIKTASQILAEERAAGRMRAWPRQHGEVELTLREADGTIVKQIKQKNLQTRWMKEMMAYNRDATFPQSSMRIFISNEDFDTHIRKNYARATYPDAMSIGGSYTLNITSYTWTYRGTFGQPSSDRYIYSVGLSTCGGEYNQGSIYSTIWRVFAMTHLTSSILQTTTQTLEAVYRVSLTQA